MATKSSNKKSGSVNAGKAGTKPDAAGKAGASNPPANDKPKRAYKRTPIMTRAGKLVSQLGKKATALLKMASRWVSDDETEQQTDALNAIVDNLREIEPRIGDVSTSLKLLIDTSWTPKAGAPGRRPLAEGDDVQVKEKFYDPVAHGSKNLFTVASTTEKYVLIRAKGADGATPFPIERSKVKGATTDVGSGAEEAA